MAQTTGFSDPNAPAGQVAQGAVQPAAPQAQTRSLGGFGVGQGGAVLGGAAPVNGSGAPGQSAPGPSASNTQTGNFNTGYIDPATAAVHDISHGPEYDQRVIDAYYGNQKQMLDPQWQQQQQDQETQLTNMGLSRGSDAWNREADNLNRNKTMAYNTAQNSAILAGGQEATRQQQEEIARGNFANAAGQQDFTNRIGSQQAQNTALTAQQNAAQGWENFLTQRANTNRSAQATESAAASNAAGMTGAAGIAANASMSNASMNNSLQTRIQNSNEQQMNFNNARTQMYDPIQLQNLAMQGMYPTGAPTYAGGPNPTAAGPVMPNSASYAQQMAAGNNQSAGGINSALGSLGGLFMP